MLKCRSTLVMPRKEFIKSGKAELIPNGSLPKTCSEEAFTILQRRHEIKLEEPIEKWRKEQAAIMRNMLRHVDQTCLKGRSESSWAPWFISMELPEVIEALKDKVPPLRRSKRLIENYIDDSTVEATAGSTWRSRSFLFVPAHSLHSRSV